VFDSDDEFDNYDNTINDNDIDTFENDIVENTIDIDDVAMDVDVDIDNVMSSSDDSDVEEKHNVYINQKLTGYLYLLQFPTRTIPLSSQSDAKITAKMKQAAKKLEFTLNLNTSSQFYNRDTGLEMGKADTDDPLLAAFDTGEYTASNKLLDKQAYSSSSLPLNANYLVGVFDNGTPHPTYL
jgi:hypothetical protein